MDTAPPHGSSVLDDLPPILANVMDADTDKRIERLENQVAALSHLLIHTLEIMKDSCLERYQQREKARIDQMLQSLKSIKAPRR
jgi:hypothetical protein